MSYNAKSLPNHDTLEVIIGVITESEEKNYMGVAIVICDGSS